MKSKRTNTTFKSKRKKLNKENINIDETEDTPVALSFREQLFNLKEFLIIKAHIPSEHKPKIPTHRKSLLQSVLKNTIVQDADGEFAEAKDKLSLSYVPNTLHCRDEECKQIKKCILKSISSSSNYSSLYISGMPGTGKTVSLEKVLQELKPQTDGKCKIIKINGMELENYSQVYAIIHTHLFHTKRNISPTEALINLTKYFLQHKPPKYCKKIESSILLIIDEIDAIATKKQNILYNIFEWAVQPQSCLTIIGIANTMNLTESLEGKIKSRFGKERIVFRPYTSKQIALIIDERLKSSRIFDNEAIKFISMKMASICGDLRRSLYLCNEALAYANKDNSSKVELRHVQRIELELANTTRGCVIQHMPEMVLICIISIVIESHHCSEQKNCIIESVISRMMLICAKMQVAYNLSTSEVLKLIIKLKNRGIITYEKERVCCIFYNDEILYSLKNDALKQILEQELNSNP